MNKIIQTQIKKILDNKQILKQLQYILIVIGLIVQVLNDGLSIIQVLTSITMTPREMGLCDDQLFLSVLSVITMIILIKRKSISMNTDTLRLEFEINDTLLMINVKVVCLFIFVALCGVYTVQRCHFFVTVFSLWMLKMV